MRIILNFDDDTISVDDVVFCSSNSKFERKIAKHWPLVFLLYILDCCYRYEDTSSWDSKDYYLDYDYAKDIQARIISVTKRDDSQKQQFALVQLYPDSNDIKTVLHKDYKDLVTQCIRYLNEVVFRDANAALNDVDITESPAHWNNKVIEEMERTDFDDAISGMYNDAFDDDKASHYDTESELYLQNKIEDKLARALKCYKFNSALDGQSITWEVKGDLKREIKSYKSGTDKNGIKDFHIKLLGIYNGKWNNEAVRTRRAGNHKKRIIGSINRGQAIDNKIDMDRESLLHMTRIEHERLFWNGNIIKELAEEYGNKISKINEQLLPAVSACNGEDQYPNLLSFVESFIDNNGKYSERGGIAIVEGAMGSGKTYSLNRVAKKLCDRTDIECYAFIVPLYALQHGNEKQSLSSYLCKYMQGAIGDDPLIAVQTLLQQAYEFEEKNREKKQKVVIIIDCVDEAYTGSYNSLAAEIASILNVKKRVKDRHIKYRNSYFILATRNAESFKKNINMTGGCWSDIVDVKIEQLNYESFDNDLGRLMKEKEEFRRPLFASYYNEIKNLQNDLTTDAAENIKEYGEIKEYKEINNYYDLFDVKTQLLIEHARTEGSGATIYSDVLPYLAFHICCGKRKDQNSLKKSFDSDELYQLLSKDYDEERKESYQEYGCAQIDKSRYHFRQLSEDTFVSELFKTGIIIPNKEIQEEYTILEFEHQEYMQFLAAIFAARIILDNNHQLSYDILRSAVEKTSFYDKDLVIGGAIIESNEIAPEDRIAMMPFGYYLIKSISEYGMQNSDDDEFNPMLYMLKTNIGHEKLYDIWNDTEGMLKKILSYYEARLDYLLAIGQFYKRPLGKGRRYKYYNKKLLISRKTMLLERKLNAKRRIRGKDRDRRRLSHKSIRRKYRPEYENPVFVNSANAFLYTTITNPIVMGNRTKSEKRKVLEHVSHYLEQCALRILWIVFSMLKAEDRFRKIYLSSNRNVLDGSDFFCAIMDDLLDLIHNQGEFDVKDLPFDIDIVGRVYSDLGAVKQQRGKEAYSSRNDSYADFLKEAETYHNYATQFRELMSQINNGVFRSEIALSRGYITLATDKYYQGLYAQDTTESIAYFNEAINNYYQKALQQQGSELGHSEKLELGKPIPEINESKIKEKPREDTEPFVIYTRIAGCYYEMWKLIGEDDIDKKNHLLHKQLVSVRAAYLYLYNKCLENVGSTSLHAGKLELNTSEINNLLSDCKKKYANSFSCLDELERKNALALLNSVRDLYKELHKNSEIGLFEENKGHIELNYK